MYKPTKLALIILLQCYSGYLDCESNRTLYDTMHTGLNECVAKTGHESS